VVHSPTPNCGGKAAWAHSMVSKVPATSTAGGTLHPEHGHLFGALRRHIFLALCCFLMRENYNELFEVGVAWLTARTQTPASS
jgi:hypothetical protein